jgi:hypothetical protein
MTRVAASSRTRIHRCGGDEINWASTFFARFSVTLGAIHVIGKSSCVPSSRVIIAPWKRRNNDVGVEFSRPLLTLM